MNKRSCRLLPLLRIFLLVLMTQQGFAATGTDDTWRMVNRPVFHINKALDTWLLKPLAIGYERYLPSPAKACLRNFFNNVDDVNVVINDVLQLKLQQAGDDGTRLLLNTTLGVGGLFDPASRLGFNKNNEDFGQTLAVWGMHDSPYLVLPLLGPSTLRDAAGRYPDYLLNPLRLLSDSQTRSTLFATRQVDERASWLAAEQLVRGDEYSFTRNAYLQRREYLIADGEVYDEFDDF